VTFGWQSKNRPTSGASGRVHFRPSDDGGSGGVFAAPKLPGGNPRPILNWNVFFDVFVWARAPLDANDEWRSDEANVRAVVNLVERTMQAIEDYRSGRYIVASPRWVVEPTENMNGRELRFQLVAEMPLYDADRVAVVPQPIAQQPRKLPLPPITP